MKQLKNGLNLAESYGGALNTKGRTAIKFVGMTGFLNRETIMQLKTEKEEVGNRRKSKLNNFAG